MCMTGGEGVYESLLKFHFVRNLTLAQTCTLSPKPQTLFSKVSHQDLKQPEMVSPSSPPTHTQTGPWGPWQSQIPR